LKFAGVFVAAFLAAAAPASAQAPQSPYVQRLRMLAQLQTLNADLLSRDSATAVLQALCDRRDPEAPRMRARRVEAPDDPRAAAAARRQLGAAANEPIRLRRVELICGETVLSRADNWYLPGRLTQEMNTQLDTTQTPFGVVVAALRFQRRTLSSRLLFQPLPAGWEAQGELAFDGPATPPPQVLQHHAVLQTPDGRPFSLLVETYTDRVLTP
jgi:chorismate-pyruvate lyase